MKSLVYLKFLAILGTISNLSCYRLNSMKSAFSKYIENELQTSFGICPKLLASKVNYNYLAFIKYMNIFKKSEKKSVLSISFKYLSIFSQKT